MSVNAVARKTPKTDRPAEKVLRELGGKDIRWNVDKHLAGCLRAYEQNPSYGTAVYFALEAIATVLVSGGLRDRAGILRNQRMFFRDRSGLGCAIYFRCRNEEETRTGCGFSHRRDEIDRPLQVNADDLGWV